MDNWNEWSRHVLAELKRHDQNHKELSKEMQSLENNLEKKLNALHIDIITLKVKSSTWGAVAGMIAGTLFSALVSFIFGRN